MGERSYGSAFTGAQIDEAVSLVLNGGLTDTKENVFSTEETRIGTWIDGKPLYRKVIECNFPTEINRTLYLNKSLPNNSRIIRYEGITKTSSGNSLAIYANGYTYISFVGVKIYGAITISEFSGALVTLICEYTKTTD